MGKAAIARLPSEKAFISTVRHYKFRAVMGEPADLRQVPPSVLGEVITATVLRLGNPRCVVLGPLPEAGRFNRLGPALSMHAMFPSGTDVEFASIEAPRSSAHLDLGTRGRTDFFIRYRASSGAVSASAHGGASRSVDVVASGGTQRVDWRDDGMHLTGWAELLLGGQWLG